MTDCPKALTSRSKTSLAAPVSGTIPGMVWALNASALHFYSGDGSSYVPVTTSIPVLPEAGYSMGDMGP